MNLSTPVSAFSTQSQKKHCDKHQEKPKTKKTKKTSSCTITSDILTPIPSPICESEQYVPNQIVPSNDIVLPYESTPIVKQPKMEEEFIKTRKDMSRHFLDMNGTLEKNDRGADARHSELMMQMKESNDLSRQMVVLAGTSATCDVKSQVSTRLKLGAAIDQFFRVLSPLHKHPDGNLFYSPLCEKCTKMEKIIYQAVSITDKRLLLPMINDTTISDLF